MTFHFFYGGVGRSVGGVGRIRLYAIDCLVVQSPLGRLVWILLLWIDTKKKKI